MIGAGRFSCDDSFFPVARKLMAAFFDPTSKRRK
jgi:hypothetical protein